MASCNYDFINMRKKHLPDGGGGAAVVGGGAAVVGGGGDPDRNGISE